MFQTLTAIAFALCFKRTVGKIDLSLSSLSTASSLTQCLACFVRCCVAMDHIDFKSALSFFQSLARATLKKATTGVDFTNILHAAFTCSDPKSAKKTDGFYVFFML